MALRSFDVVVFGATGYIGESIAKYIHQHQLFAKWAILGRNHGKLAELMADLAELRGDNLPDMLIADAQDVRSLRDIFLESRLLINCLAPLTLYKDIIEACLMARCDYVDLCSDVNFIQSNFLEFQLESQKKGVCIMHGFGFDAAIAELGALLARSISGNGSCQLIESFLHIQAPKGYCHRELVDSIISSSKNSKSIKNLRHKIDDKFRIPSIKHPGAKVERKQPYYFDNRIGMFATPSLGAESHLVANAFRSHCLREQQTTQPQYHSYLASDNYLSTTGTAFYTAVLHSLGSYSMGRSLVRSFPEMLTDGLLNRRRPNAEQIAQTTFQMLFLTKGFLKTVGTPVDSDGDMPGGLVHSQSLSDISDLDSSRLSRRGYVMTSDRSVVDSNVGILPCTMLSSSSLGGGGSSSFTRPRSRSRYIVTDMTTHTAVEKWLKVKGPDPYYTATTILVARLTHCYLQHKNEQAHLTTKTLPLGGVFTPSGIFLRLPTVYDVLTDAGIEFVITSAAAEEAQQLQDLLDQEELAAFQNEKMGNKTEQVGEVITDNNILSKAGAVSTGDISVLKNLLDDTSGHGLQEKAVLHAQQVLLQQAIHASAISDSRHVAAATASYLTATSDAR